MPARPTGAVVLFLAGTILSTSGFAQARPDSAGSAVFNRTDFANLIFAEISVPAPPTIFRADGGQHLAYEIFIANTSGKPWEIRRVTAANGQSAAVLLDASGPALHDALVRWPRAQASKGDATVLGPGERAVFYAWIDLPKGAPAPQSLEHHVTFRPASGGTELTIETEPVAVGSETFAITAPPFEGTNWVAASGPSNTSRHRRAILVLGGVDRVPQRFAIDWLQIDREGHTFKGSPSDNRSYYAYGKEIHAVLGGVVTEMKDGIPDNKAGEWPTNRTNLETIAGNHLVIDVGRGRWMLYAHMQPGSVRVKPGDRVVAGQVLGRLGNSGNTPEPHLHLQLLDRNSALGGQGLPYDMPRFKLLGKAVLAFGGAKVAGGPSAAWLAQPEERRNEIPLENAIVEFVK
jgi:hypothetical protein